MNDPTIEAERDRLRAVLQPTPENIVLVLEALDVEEPHLWHAEAAAVLAALLARAGRSLAPTDDDGLEEILAVLRDPRVPLPGEEYAANVVLARGCKPCLRAEHPYWHQAGTPCPQPGLT
jgi:hypothetical protein